MYRQPSLCTCAKSYAHTCQAIWHAALFNSAEISNHVNAEGANSGHPIRLYFIDSYDAAMADDLTGQ